MNRTLYFTTISILVVMGSQTVLAMNSDSGSLPNSHDLFGAESPPYSSPILVAEQEDVTSDNEGILVPGRPIRRRDQADFPPVTPHIASATTHPVSDARSAYGTDSSGSIYPDDETTAVQQENERPVPRNLGIVILGNPQNLPLPRQGDENAINDRFSQGSAPYSGPIVTRGANNSSGSADEEVNTQSDGQSSFGIGDIILDVRPTPPPSSSYCSSVNSADLRAEGFFLGSRQQ